MCACRPRHLLFLMFLIIFYGCAELATKTEGASVRKSTKTDVTGVWQGRTIADCAIVTTTNPGRCSAMQLITLTMFQDGQRVTGSYRCAFGNEECRGLAESGVIRDGHGVLEGRYQCHWGGPAEWGGFRVERSY